MDFLKEAKKNEPKFLRHACELLQIDSVLVETPESSDAPFGPGIRQSLDYILKLARKFGFKTRDIGHVAGEIEYGEGDEIIGVLCHVDVVPAAGEWKYPPFGATVENGRIYGRGSSDDKGPAMAALYALKILKDLNFEPNKRIRLIIGTDEETSWRGIKKYFEKCEMPTMGFSPDAGFPLIYGEKGIMSIDLTSDRINDLFVKSGVRYNVVPDFAEAKMETDAKADFAAFLSETGLKGEYGDLIKLAGKNAHAMEPDNGINAAIKLCMFLSRYTKNNLVQFVAQKLSDSRFRDLGLAFSDPEMGDLTVNVAFVEIRNFEGRIGLNLRYPINWDKEGFLRKLILKSKEFGLTVKVVSDQVPHYVDKNDPLIKTLHEAYVKVTGDDKSEIKTIGGGTYGRALKKGVAFGPLFPGREEVAHQADEYVVIDDLIAAMAIYATALYELSK